jgi:hypothetical protein
MKCHRHQGRSFTVYPLGFGPYLRKKFAPVSSDGDFVWSEDPSVASAEVVSWENTLMSSAFDASRSKRWSRESPSEDARRRRTQDRHLELSALFLGLSTALDTATAQLIAEALGVAYLHLVESRRAYEAATTFVEKGNAIVRTISLLQLDKKLSLRFLKSGSLAGVWGARLWWDPG